MCLKIFQLIWFFSLAFIFHLVLFYHVLNFKDEMQPGSHTELKKKQNETIIPPLLSHQ